MGQRTSPMNTLVFDDVYVSAQSSFRRSRAGATLFTDAIDWEPTCLFASHADDGTSLGEIHRLCANPDSVWSGNDKFQAISHRIAVMNVQLEAARLLVYKAATLAERSCGVSLDASIAKLFVSEALVRTALDTVQIMGGYGYTSEGDIERCPSSMPLAARFILVPRRSKKNISARLLSLL